jgi:hypothetical protein
MNATRFNLDATLVMLLLLAAAGCAARKDSVPQDAKLITERSGGLAFAATDLGTLYITKKNSGKVVYSSEVKFGDKLIFYPESKRVILNGNVVKEDQGFDPKQTHRLYFLKG